MQLFLAILRAQFTSGTAVRSGSELRNCYTQLTRGPTAAILASADADASASPFSPDRGQHLGNRPIAVKVSAVSNPCPAAVKVGLGST
jgi:hypothetical protein